MAMEIPSALSGSSFGFTRPNSGSMRRRHDAGTERFMGDAVRAAAASRRFRHRRDLARFLDHLRKCWVGVDGANNGV